MRNVGSKLHAPTCVIDLSLEPGPIVKIAERRAFSRQHACSVVIREVGLDVNPPAIERRRQKKKNRRSSGYSKRPTDRHRLILRRYPELRVPTKRPRLFLIDSYGFIFRAFHARARSAAPPMRTTTGLSTEAVYIFNNMVRKLAKVHKPVYMAAIFESQQPTHRSVEFAE